MLPPRAASHLLHGHPRKQVQRYPDFITSESGEPLYLKQNCHLHPHVKTLGA